MEEFKGGDSKYERFLNARALFVDLEKCKKIIEVIERRLIEKAEGMLELCVPLELPQENTFYFVLTSGKNRDKVELDDLKKFLEEIIQCDVIVYLAENSSDAKKYYSYAAPLQVGEAIIIWRLMFNHFSEFFRAVPREPSPPEKPRRFDNTAMVIKDSETIEIQAESEAGAVTLSRTFWVRQWFVDPEDYWWLSEEIVRNVLGAGYKIGVKGAIVTVTGNLSNFIHTLHYTEQMGCLRFLKMLKALHKKKQSPVLLTVMNAEEKIFEENDLTYAAINGKKILKNIWYRSWEQDTHIYFEARKIPSSDSPSKRLVGWELQISLEKNSANIAKAWDLIVDLLQLYAVRFYGVFSKKAAFRGTESGAEIILYCEEGRTSWQDLLDEITKRFIENDVRPGYLPFRGIPVRGSLFFTCRTREKNEVSVEDVPSYLTKLKITHLHQPMKPERQCQALLGIFYREVYEELRSFSRNFMKMLRPHCEYLRGFTEDYRVWMLGYAVEAIGGEFHPFFQRIVKRLMWESMYLVKLEREDFSQKSENELNDIRENCRQRFSLMNKVLSQLEEELKLIKALQAPSLVMKLTESRNFVH